MSAVVRTSTGKLDFDATALPASVHSILTARVDRLASGDRALLQAASVIGRHFDPELLAIATGETDLDARLAAMQALDLVHRESKSDDYAFKHALVRDALYQSLLTEPRAALHAKIAEEIERCSSNRFAEVAKVLAYHYSQTNQVKKAFLYLTMAGSKSLGVYSLDEATTHFTCRSRAPRQRLGLRVRQSGCRVPCLLHASTKRHRPIEPDDRCPSAQFAAH